MESNLRSRCDLDGSGDREPEVDELAGLVVDVQVLVEVPMSTGSIKVAAL